MQKFHVHLIQTKAKRLHYAPDFCQGPGGKLNKNVMTQQCSLLKTELFQDELMLTGCNGIPLIGWLEFSGQRGNGLLILGIVCSSC